MPLRPNIIGLRPAGSRSGRLHHGIIALLACVCSALICSEIWQLWQIRQANFEETDVVSSNTARAMAQQVETTLQTADTVVATLVKQVQDEGTGPEALARLSRLMTSLAVALPAIHEMGLTDSHGDAIAKSLRPNPRGLNYADREYFNYHATHPDLGPFIGARIQSKIDGDYSITVTRRINNKDGSFGGLAVASVSLDFFQQLFNKVLAGSGGVIALISDDDTIIVRSPPVGDSITHRLFLSSLKHQAENTSHPNSVSYVSAIDGVDRRGSFEHLDHFPMNIFVSQSEWDVQRSLRRELNTHAVILGFVIMVLLVLGKVAISASGTLATQAMYDGLTGLPNRRAFDETLQREIRRAARSGMPLSVILVDVDHFKAYNDYYGHPAGDECLRIIARTIQDHLKRTGEFAARFGGEEFAILLPGSDHAGAFTLAETMRTAVRSLALQHSPRQGGIVTFSAGIGGIVPGMIEGCSELLISMADDALYAAKAAGRDMVQPAPKKPVLAARPAPGAVSAIQSS
jgi:diguanylate cyclase (GGDEF)-like protein